MGNLFDVFFNPRMIGYERMPDLLDSLAFEANGFPKYNLIKKGKDFYVIEIAVAGYTKDDLEVELHKNVLTVRGSNKSLPTLTSESVKDDSNRQVHYVDTSVEYVHQGIARRSFARQWVLADDVVIHDIKLENGILSVNLERNVREEDKPKLLTIG